MVLMLCFRHHLTQTPHRETQHRLRLTLSSTVTLSGEAHRRELCSDKACGAIGKDPPPHSPIRTQIYRPLACH